MYNRTSIMRRAWELYRRAVEVRAANGMAPLPHHVLIGNTLRTAWPDAKFEQQVANLPTQPTSGPAAELASLNAKDFWSRDDYRRADELRRAA